jgi:hypothetical protein
MEEREPCCGMAELWIWMLNEVDCACCRSCCQNQGEGDLHMAGGGHCIVLIPQQVELR